MVALGMSPAQLAPPPAGSGLRPVLGDTGLPVIGHTWEHFYRPVETARKRYDRYGPVSWTHFMGRRAVSVLGPEATEVVLVNRDKAFSNTEGWKFFAERLFPRGLILLDFDEHLHHRRIMQEAFTATRLRRYLDDMNPIIAAGIRGWPPGRRFRAQTALRQLTLDVAAKVFIGVELGPAADGINRAFVDTIRGTTAWVRFPVPGLRWSRGLAGRRVLEDFLRSRLPATRDGAGADLLSVLCRAQTDDGHRFGDVDVINHLAFLLMAAHDTSTITMTTMVYHLAKHPDWQQRLRERSLALGAQVLDYDDLDAVPELDWVMKEALRLLAPVTALPRATVKDTEILGHYVPRGTWVMLSPLFTHLMHEYWPAPDTFDPQRFAPDRRDDKVHRYAWMPFGGGAHKCIGMAFGAMEVKATMHQLLQRYRWSVDPSYRARLDLTTLPRVKDGLPIRLERIEDRAAVRRESR